MKTLIIAKYHPLSSGGIERAVHTLSEGLARRGHEIDVLCFDLQKKPQASMLSVKYNIISFDERLNFFSNPININHLITLKKIVRNYDLIHVHSPHPLPEMLLTQINQKPPMVATIHSHVFKPKSLAMIYNEFHYKFLSKVSKIIVPSKQHIQFIPNLKHELKRIEVVPFGMPSYASSEQPRGKDILFVGRLVKYKGLFNLINAMKNTSFNLSIAGDGPLKNKLQSHINACGLNQQVTLLGDVSAENLKPLYNDHKLLVLPSIDKRECFGIVLIEAMSAGMPVITTNLNTGVNYVNQHEETGLVVDPNNTQQLAEAIKRILSNPSLQEYFSKNSLERYQSLFAVSKMIDSHERIYRELKTKSSSKSIVKSRSF